MKTQSLILIGFTALSLTACSTFEGLQRDISGVASNIGNKVTSITEKQEEAIPATVVQNDGTCPPITIDPQLDSMSEFSDMEKPTAKTLVSTIKLTGTQNVCKLDGEYLDMRIDLNFAGELGPNAKRKDNDRPFFAYPYFVIIEDGQGEQLAKEIFAASVTYAKDQEKLELIETIRQRLPLNDNGSVPPYQVKIGFELTQAQLIYNAQQ